MDTMDTIMDFFKSKGKGDGIGVDSDLFGGGFVNSLFALELVLFLEDTFHIRLKKKDINQQSFHSVRSIAGLVDRLAGGA